MREYLNNIKDGLVTVFIGMKITFLHLFTPSVTIQYPSVKVPMVDRARNRLFVNIDDCIGCDQCARACPVSCISIDTVKGLPTDDLGKTSQGKKKALWVTKFDIDFAKCCYCQLCVFPCPTECIYMTDEYEFSQLERTGLLYKFSALSPEDVEQKKENFQKFEAEKAAAKAAAPKPVPVVKPTPPPPASSAEESKPEN
ncbi:MAG: NADPH-quinone oxidoreductase [Ignavibacteria bacterium CG22_combo_CG10-13_8_21_14_all_37_15]|nr:MAG: NADPH-quinone oxidoreductase [Ignavibacteria bacterium CG22_combo_CG10-13_8_21_14_all_37_15]